MLTPLRDPDQSVFPKRTLRIAVVHEWLVTYAGSERAVREILALYPGADFFAVIDFLSDEDRSRFGGRRPKTTFIQRLPFARKRYRSYLPLMPLAIEQLDLSGYDLIISSSHAVAKGVLTGPDQIHICYCYTPIRYAWDLQHQYLAESGLTKGLKSIVARVLLHYIRMWDLRTVPSVDRFVAISNFVARRIRKIYGREADVIYAPVDISKFPLQAKKEDFYLAASRMVPYKRMDLIVEAFAAMPDRRLVVIGDGPEFEKVKRLAGPNVTILGYQSDLVLRDHLQRARAFIFAAQEDQGLLPIEAQACGTPVIAYRKGGASETVVEIDNARRDAPTGVFFEAQSPQSIVEAVAAFERSEPLFLPESCRANAERFSTETFHAQFAAMVEETAVKIYATRDVV
jgi:glycosyltransferase involved in cell wall biosynthesis